jgi:hypothetical protein
MKKRFLLLFLASSSAFAQPAGAPHPLAPECTAIDTDCIAEHDGRVVTLATFMGVASYCKASTTPAPCRQAVAVVKAEQRLAAKATAAAAAAASTETAAVLDLSEPETPEGELPEVVQKGAL